MSNRFFSNTDKQINNIEFRNVSREKIYVNQNIFLKKSKESNVQKKNNNLFKKKTMKDLIKVDYIDDKITLANNNNKIYKNKHIKLLTRSVTNPNTDVNIIMPKSIDTITKINNYENLKNLLIYQNQNMHTEVIGMIMHNFSEFNIYVFHPHYDSSSNSIPYYENIFKKKVIYTNDICEEFYDIIIVLTSGEINSLNPIYPYKYILINHENGTVNNNFFNVSLTPIVKSNYTILPIYEYINNNTRNNQISIIGSLQNHQRDIPNIFKLISNFPMYRICLFTRCIDPKNKKTFMDYKNFIIFEKNDTTSMINEIRKSKFVYTADTLNYTEKGIRGGILTGMVPIALNNNIPLIMTKRLNLIYNLQGVIEYEQDIMELETFLTNLDANKYNDLVQKSKSDCKRICMENTIKFSIIKDKFLNKG